MAEKAHSKTPAKPLARSGKAKGGRPTRAEALRRRIEAAGIDFNLIDPRRVLAAIAIDENAPHAARVTACRTLLAHEARLAALVAAPVEDEEPIPVDLVTERALALMAAGRGGIQ